MKTLTDNEIRNLITSWAKIYLCLKTSGAFKKNEYYTSDEVRNYLYKSKNNMTEWYFQYKFDKMFKYICQKEDFKLFLSRERDRKIEEILND